MALAPERKMSEYLAFVGDGERSRNPCLRRLEPSLRRLQGSGARSRGRQNLTRDFHAVGRGHDCGATYKLNRGFLESCNINDGCSSDLACNACQILARQNI